MKITKLITVTTALSAATLLITPGMMAQSPAPVPTASATASPAPGGSPGGHEDYRQRMTERLNETIKSELKVADDEWAVIQPLLEKVESLQRESMMGRFGGLMGGFGRQRQHPEGEQANGSPSPAAGGNTNNRPDRAGSPEAQALKAALDAGGTSTDDIKAKLQALRDSRKKAEADLDQAREDLKKVLTLRQEATLVMMGILD